MTNMWNHVRLVLRITFRLLWWTLVLPWLALALFRAGGRRLEGQVRGLLALRVAFDRHARCPRGHRSELRGLWECRGCGGLFPGSAFQACPVCGSACGHIACERCGLAIRNPLA